MPARSRRADSPGTGRAFVVGESDRLQRAGREAIRSSCIGQPDFPTPPHMQDAAVEAIRIGKHGDTPPAGVDELRPARPPRK